METINDGETRGTLGTERQSTVRAQLRSAVEL